MSDNNNAVVLQTATNNQIIANPDAEPVILNRVLKEMGMLGIPIPARDLIDQTFVIVRAKQFASAYPTQDHAWFCLLRIEGSPDLYQTVIGGGAPTEILDAYAASGQSAPLQVTLRQKQGGRFGRYYTFE